MFWRFCTWEIYSLALSLSIMSYQFGNLSNPQWFKVCCNLVVTWEVTCIGADLWFGFFCTWEIHSLALSLSIVSYQYGLLSNSQRLKVCCNLIAT